MELRSREHNVDLTSHFNHYVEPNLKEEMKLCSLKSLYFLCSLLLYEYHLAPKFVAFHIRVEPLVKLIITFTPTPVKVKISYGHSPSLLVFTAFVNFNFSLTNCL